MEHLWKSIIRGPGRYFLAPLFWPLSKLFQFVVFIRNWLFDKRLKHISYVDVPVISVGNIVAGGSGKTPVTIMLGKLLSTNKIAILSRGYRSQAEYKGEVTAFTHKDGFSAEEVGDEPLMISNRLPESRLYIGSDRLSSANQAVLEGCEMLLLDDGFQHRRLGRDFDVVVMDSNDPWGGGAFLPWGSLRETSSALQRAHLIILTNVIRGVDLEALKMEIGHYSAAKIIATKLVHSGCLELKGVKVGAFCAIAKPENFYKTLSDLGASVINRLELGDHCSAREDRLMEFMKECRAIGCLLVVCTEKDFVKIDRRKIFPLPLKVLKVDMEVIEGQQFLCRFLDMVQKKIK